MSRRFSDLYEIWAVERRLNDDEVEAILIETLRETWNRGETRERIAVLFFLLTRQHRAGFDLITDALRSDDAEVASTAVSVAAVLLRQGHDLGESIRAELLSFGERFPEWKGTSAAAVMFLDRPENQA
jgi:hypothetical protein